MLLKFSKYQGTGNDFVMIDNRSGTFPLKNIELIKKLCDRRFGIGADGLICLQAREGFDFEMIYFNSDGRLSTMCGNGGRCMIRFADDLGLIRSSCYFWAIDGPHEGLLHEDGIVSLKMKDVQGLKVVDGRYLLDTGSPHLVEFVQHLKDYPVNIKGPEIRYSEAFIENGINVNFAEPELDGSLYVRTYERGVEAETLSCGTGVVAAAIAWYFQNKDLKSKIAVKTPGGDLSVSFTEKDLFFSDIWLRGRAESTFSGQIAVP